MMTQTIATVNYDDLEEEWLSLRSAEDKKNFWKRMRQLFATLDAAQIERFFEQLQKHATDVALRLELATQRAELAGFVRKTS